MPKNKLFREIDCPECEMPIDIEEHGAQLHCLSCHSNFELLGRLCPKCSSYHYQQQQFCSECDAEMSHVCPRCDHNNWGGDEYCQQCEYTLHDITEKVLERFKPNKREEFFYEAQKTGAKQAKLEEEGSKKRMAKLMAIEKERLDELDAQAKEQKIQEKKMWGALMIGAGAILFCFLLQLLFS